MPKTKGGVDRSWPKCPANRELREMMQELHVDQTSDLQTLRISYTSLLDEYSQQRDSSKLAKLPQAFKVLKHHLELGNALPAPLSTADEEKSESENASSSSDESSSEHNAELSGADKKRKGAKGRKRYRGRRHRKGENGDDGEEGEECGEDTTPHTGPVTLADKKFIHGYEYDDNDLSSYVDPFSHANFRRDTRRVRGGLVLLKDFHRNDGGLPKEYEGLRDEYDIIGNPQLEVQLRELEDGVNGDDLKAFARRMRTFVYLDWALAGDIRAASVENRFHLKNVTLERFEERENESAYRINLRERGDIDFDIFSPGLHVDVRSATEKKYYTAAVIEEIDVERKMLSLFFIDLGRLEGVLEHGNVVSMAINASAFVYRSLIRSIDFVEARNMIDTIFPSLDKLQDESYKDFERDRAKELHQMDFSDEDGFNYLQRCAVHSIVKKASGPYPFILFGPPGTGKTVTLIEAIRHLVAQSKDNRILVCTPSRMAADNFAETLLARNFLHPKYVFRLHSLSTSAQQAKRNKKLDAISYMPKEAKNRFFGMPSRLNLQLFRVIICTLSTSSYLISAGGLRGYFTHIFVDESGQSTEPETWTPIGGLADSQTSVVLAGDPKQLGPVIRINVSKDFGYGTSMMKRLIFSRPYEFADHRSMVILQKTYRSHFSILRPCSYLFYSNVLQPNEEDSSLLKLCDWEGLPTKGFPVIFHSSACSNEQRGEYSFSNQQEINLVVHYVQKILNETGIAEKDIGVISPYKNQVMKLRKALSTNKAVTIDCVEGFQGSQREVIIISTVRTMSLGFLSCDLRLNTSISRAKSLLVVIGDERLLQQHLNWKKFIFYCHFHGGFIGHKGGNGELLMNIADMK